MRKRIAEAKTTNVTLSINQTETCDATGKQINSMNQTFTADSLDEIDRILHLAGIGRSGTAVEAEPTVRMLIQGGHPAGCQCQQCCHPDGCRCQECCGITEGRDLPPGFHDYEAHGPEDAVDLNFNTAEDELTEQGVGHMDYGHRDDETDTYDLSAFSHDHGRAGNPVRYTPANSGGNPMKSDMVEDDESVEASYSEAVNDAVRQIANDPSAIDACVEQIASEFGKSADEVHQEILDQRDALGDDPAGTDDEIQQHLMMATEGRVRIEESIQMLAENHSPAFVSALHKVRDGLFESLDAAEISNLATAFINLMQTPDSQRVARTHRAFRQYVSEAAMLREYRKFAGK